MNARVFQAAAVVTVFFSSLTLAQNDYKDVLVVVNSNSPISDSIGTYFAQVRNIPKDNIAYIAVSTKEEIDSTEFNKLRSQLENYISANRLEKKINYIVTTKGMPLAVNRGNTFSPSSPSSSVESELSLILGPYSGNIGQPARCNSPFFQQNTNFSRRLFGIYLVTRLDGYNFSNIKALIDRAAVPNPVNSQTMFVFDQDPAWGPYTINSSLTWAHNAMAQKGLNSYMDTSSAYVTKKQNVIGYASWGSNDHYANQYTRYAKPQNTWAPGAIVETFVSTSGRTFTSPVAYGQSVIADLIAEGVTGAKGYVFEPFSFAMAHVEVLFDRYTSGYNLAESYYMASQFLSWMDVIVGDPKATVVLSQPSKKHAAISRDANELIKNKDAGEFKLSNYPNPFNPTTEIRFTSPSDGRASLKVYNSIGQEVAVLIDGEITAGSHSVQFDASRLPSGMYFYRLQTHETVSTQRMMLVK